MAITEFSILPVGARVRVRRGRFPIDPQLPGRVGTVVINSQYRAKEVGVVLDGESEMRMFSPGELEAVEGMPPLPSDQAAARKRLARP
ncbi:MAG TPA: hypothetical protein VK966_07120 [Longimicrobiales bacterium]|nr:hypothetical protein [Longimicrobiales bacterium]